MGITGEFVKGVFYRNRSSNAKSNMADKRKWVSVRSYLCGNEINSELAEKDSASVKSSEASVAQPLTEVLIGDSQTEEIRNDLNTEEHNSVSRLFREEDAATIIQSAFRSFQVKCQRKDTIREAAQTEPLVVTESPSRKSWSTSIEVQTGNSVGAVTVGEESTGKPVSSVTVGEDSSTAIHRHAQQKPKTHIFRVKDDWDDSTVSSNISKMRIQNRLEATTRRERAMAYAFSQQLRICSKKKQNRSDDTESNMGWSWLERWMATRLPENSLNDNYIDKQLETMSSNQKILVRKILSDVAGEEKESCGSNEVPVQFDSLSVTTQKEKTGSRPPKNRLKTSRKVSKRKTVPSSQFRKESKVSKRDFPGGIEKDKSLEQNQQEIKCKPASQALPD